MICFAHIFSDCDIKAKLFYYFQSYWKITEQFFLKEIIKPFRLVVTEKYQLTIISNKCVHV